MMNDLSEKELIIYTKLSNAANSKDYILQINQEEAEILLNQMGKAYEFEINNNELIDRQRKLKREIRQLKQAKEREK